ncbi:hypothetical protein ABPG75_003715 [Micractinium tetrahymenae]
MQQAAAVAPAARPAPPELVPVRLAGSREWVLWPATAADEELAEFSEGLARDLGAAPQLSAVVADAVRQQVADWVAHVPPPVAGPEPRRELVRLDMVLGDKRLRDQFWWDLHAAEPTPEDFAAELCADMGLDACHGASVAAAIRIELAKLRRAPPTSLQLPTPQIEEGVLDAPQLAADGGTLQSAYASSCLREPEQWPEWGPSLTDLSADEQQALQQQQQAQRQRHREELSARLASRKQAQQAAELELRQRQAAAQQAAAAAAVATQQQQQQQQPQQQQPQPQQQPSQQQQQPQPQPQQPMAAAGASQGRAATQSQGTAGTAQRPPQPRPRNEEAPQRRTLRPRRAAASKRLAEILRAEEEEEEEESERSGSESEGHQGHSGGSGKRVAEGSGKRAAEVPAASKGSEEYQPGEDSLAEGERQDDAAEVSGRKPRQRKRASGDHAVHSKHTLHSRQHSQHAQQQQQQALLAQQQRQQQQQAQQGPQVVVQAVAPSLLATPQQQAMLAQLGPTSSAGMPPPLIGSSVAPGMAGGLLGPSPGPPPGMVPTPVMPQGTGAPLGGPGGSLPQPGGPLALSGAPAPADTPSAAAGPPVEQMRMVAAAIVHYARELGIGEHKIASFLARTPAEQLALFRTLHQLVQQARARQQEAAAAAGLGAPGMGAGPSGGLPGMPSGPPGLGLGPGLAGPPGMGYPPQQQQLAPMAMAPPPMPQPLGGPGLGPPLGGQGLGMPPMPLRAEEPPAPPPAGQFANLFSEMFD